jgi:transposase
MSVPGFGFIAAATVLAETNGFETLEDGHQVSAYAGLAPAPNQSGLSNRKGSISKVGNARLRRIAYLAALGARNSNSPFKAFYERLRERGKPPRLALVALARKLLRVGLAVVKRGRPYQAAYRRRLKQRMPLDEVFTTRYLNRSKYHPH